MSKKIIFIICFLIIIGVGVSFLYFYQPKQENKTNVLKQLSLQSIFKTAFAQEKLLIQAKDIILKPIQITPQVPSYSLPLETSQINNFKRVSQYINFPQAVLNSLQNKGFAIFPSTILTAKDSPSNFETDNFEAFYSYLKGFGRCSDFICSEAEKKQGLAVPLFITSDTALHYYHLIFDSSLMRMERDIFFDGLWQFDKAMLNKSIEEYKNAPDEVIKAAARKNMAYFSVGLKLLQPTDSQITTAQRLKDKLEEQNNYGVYNSIIAKCGATNAQCIRNYIEKIGRAHV